MVNVTLEEALALLKENSTVQTEVIRRTLEEANGMLLANDYKAPMHIPPFDRSPLDGYAFCAKKSVGATKEAPVKLRVVGEVYAGHPYYGEVGEGEAVRIMTGACIPKGCDCVLRQEDTDMGEDTVSIYKVLKTHDNVCFAGEDIKEGTVILKKGEKLDAVKLGILASMGISEVDVIKPICIGLLCTGDELAEVGQPLREGQIYNTNQVMLAQKLKDLGVEVHVLKAEKDDDERLVEAIEKYWDKIDMLVSTGGVSVGKADRMHQVLEKLGAERLFWRIAIQPGTPVLAAVYKQKLLIGLSGNPFASLVNFELLVRPLIAYKMADKDRDTYRTEGILQTPFRKKSQKRRFIRVRYEEGNVTIPHNNHSSGSLYTMSLCNALVDIKAGTDELEINDKVDVIVLK